MALGWPEVHIRVAVTRVGQGLPVGPIRDQLVGCGSLKHSFLTRAFHNCDCDSGSSNKHMKHSRSETEESFVLR